jgi:hypothetical protein
LENWIFLSENPFFIPILFFIYESPFVAVLMIFLFLYDYSNIEDNGNKNWLYKEAAIGSLLIVLFHINNIVFDTGFYSMLLLILLLIIQYIKYKLYPKINMKIFTA